jgi:hypothetical protein
VLVLTLAAMLMLTPSYFSHYAAVLAVPLAIVAGCACQVLADGFGRLARRARLAAGVVGVVAGLLSASMAAPTLMSPTGPRVPVATADPGRGG